MTDDKQVAVRPSFLANFLAGGVGGTCTVVVGQPFDTVKVRIQTMPLPKPGEAPLYAGVLDCARKTAGKEGLTALYKGMGAPIAGVAPLFALFFFGSSVAKRAQQTTPDHQLNLAQIFASGAFAGILTTGVMAPGERVKCILQVQQGDAHASSAKYKGPVDVVKQLYKEGGIRSIYRGTMATLARDVPASGMYLATYEGLMRLMTANNPDRELSPAKTLLAGGIAGIMNWTVAIPQDVLKSRYQTAPAGQYSGIRDVFKEMVRTEGVRSLYKGFTPVMLRAFPANAACFLGYELGLKACQKVGI